MQNNRLHILKLPIAHMHTEFSQLGMLIFQNPHTQPARQHIYIAIVPQRLSAP
jgi:hypothetical protein